MSRRYPLQPVLDSYGLVVHDPAVTFQHSGRDPDYDPDNRPLTADQVLAELAGVTTRTIRRWRTTGLTVDQAEDLAHAIGEHPALLWPSYYDDLLEVEDRRDEVA